MTPLERARRLAERAGVLTETPAPLGRGTAHQVFAVGPYAVRLVDEVEAVTASALEREAALLEHLQTRLPIAVPCPTLVATDLGGMAYRALPGRPLLDVGLGDPTWLIDDLGALLAAMSDLDAATLGELVGPDPYALDDWRDEVVEEVLAHRDVLTTWELRYVHAFARAPAPPTPTREVFCHNDLGAEHLLVDETSGHLLGVLDWSDAALTDPCRDLGRITRELGAGALDRILASAGFDPPTVDRQRIEFHARLATLEDLAHGIATGDGRYLGAARRSLAPLFGTLT
jgi:aminoglycoside phosphotransferase (APT) family kinase protein